MSIFTRVGWYPVVLACDDHLPTHTAVTPLTCTYTQQFQFISHNKYCTNHNFSAIINCLCRSFWLSESFRWVLIIPFSVAMVFCTLLTFQLCTNLSVLCLFFSFFLNPLWTTLTFLSCTDFSLLVVLTFRYYFDFLLYIVLIFLHYVDIYVL